MYDIIVAGSGPGGCIFARRASELGLKILLLDVKERGNVGNKICGDAIDKQEFQHLNIREPSGDEKENDIFGARLYAPNPKIYMDLTTKDNYGFIINRLKFGQRILNEAIDSGAEFREKTMVIKPLYRNGIVSGVFVKNKDGINETIESRIVVDATGMASIIRKQLNSSYIETKLDNKDQIVCYREILQVDNYKYKENFIHIFLSKNMAPGGYWWYFPKRNNIINIGVGVYKDPNYKVKMYYNNFIKKMAGKVIKTIHSGGGVVPVRRPIWSLVDDGIMLVGDSASVVNPLHGGGIASAMRSGYYSAEVAAQAIENDDVSKSGLWDYNRRYLTEQGSEYACLDIFRIALQNFSENELNFGLKQKLFTEQDVMNFSSGKKINIGLNINTLGKIIRGILMPDLLLTLYYLNSQVEKIKNLYKNYPETSDPRIFELWKKKVLKIYSSVKRII
ncbi:MAG: geranylgeranyl reductase family protein [Candidatus Helarchaeota archaeon]